MLSSETMPFYRNLGGAVFEERAFTSGLAALTHRKSGWSNGIFDLNNDGWKDLFAACGDVMDSGGFFSTRVSQANSVFVNLGNGMFADASSGAGADFARKAVHRGAAFGDLDNDGGVDVVVTSLNGPVEVWHNISAPDHWLPVRVEGTQSNRDGAGAKVRVVSASGTQYNHTNTAVGYGCASDPRVHFGLGSDTLVKELQVTWPSGQVQVLRDIKADQILTIREI